MLDLFEERVLQDSKLILGNKFVLEISRSPVDIDNPSITVNFDSESSIGRLTCWDSGEVYQEVIDFINGVTILDRHATVSTIGDFEELLKSFLAILKG
jgi:hypothetical protein